MIIYFCDRELNILGHASTTLPEGIRISQDKTTEDVESGVNSFECILSWDDNTRAELEQGIVAGNYILKQSDTKYDSLYQIIETESDTKEQEISLYAEDAGLDLLNTLCPATTITGTMSQMLSAFLPGDWSVRLWDVPNTSKTYEWDGESTCTERVRSVVSLWDCELYYTFRVEGLQVKEKILNVVQKRGLQEAIPQLRLNYDIDRILTKTSIADLVTALDVTGGTPDGQDTPINLKNYTYSYTDPVTNDVYTVDKTTGQMRNKTAMQRWSSAIDADGLLVGSFQFDTTDKSILSGQARAELQKRCYPAVNYEVDFATLPEDAQIGDRINIIDDDGGLYLEARLLQIETCEADDTKTATLGEYLLKSSGISEQVQALATEFAGIANTMVAGYSLTITSSNGDNFATALINTVLTANVLYRGFVCSASQLAEDGLVVKWYNQSTGTLLGTGMTYTVSNQSTINITARLETA
jgi:phage minor structural protein